MKNYIFALFLLVATLANAQTPAYNLQTNLPIGATTIATNSLVPLPILQATTYATNGVSQYYWATNTAIVSNLFTIPATNWLKITNTFIESNSITGTASNTWTVLETVTNRNLAAYYVTNAAFVTAYYSTNYTTNVVLGVTNVYRWQTNRVAVTNAAVITTNYQQVVFTVPVSFTAFGTNTAITTNLAYGARFIDVTRSASAAIYIGYRLTGPGTGPVGFGYYPSVDGVTTNTGPGVDLDFFLNANGTNWVSTNVSVNVGPFGYLNLAYLTNGNANIVTNLILKVAQKQSAP